MRTTPAAYVDRVSDSTVLVMGGEDRRTITIWRTSDKRRWIVTDEADDVDARTRLDSAVNVALARLGVDPTNPTIERDDER